MPDVPKTPSFRKLNKSLAGLLRSKRVLNLTRRSIRPALVPATPGIQIHWMKVDSATQAQAAVVASLKATKRFEKTNKRLMSKGERVCPVKELYLRQGKSWSRTTRLSSREAHLIEGHSWTRGIRLSRVNGLSRSSHSLIVEVKMMSQRLRTIWMMIRSSGLQGKILYRAHKGYS